MTHVVAEGVGKIDGLDAAGLGADFLDRHELRAGRHDRRCCVAARLRLPHLPQPASNKHTLTVLMRIIPAPVLFQGVSISNK